MLGMFMREKISVSEIRSRHLIIIIVELKITKMATATATSLKKRFNEDNSGCARELSRLIHFFAVLFKTAT